MNAPERDVVTIEMKMQCQNILNMGKYFEYLFYGIIVNQILDYSACSFKLFSIFPSVFKIILLAGH